jgi:putative ABC transport system permease protein
MIKLYFKQVRNLLRQEKLFSILYIVGTGLSITVVMVLSIVYYIRIANVYPETNRDRLLATSFIVETYKNEGWDGSNSLSYPFIETCFRSLKSAEAVTAIHKAGYWYKPYLQPVGSKEQLPVVVKYIDPSFWTVFPFHFVSGQSFTEADFQSGIPTAVIAESLAKRLYGKKDATGEYVSLDFRSYRVCGVVKDASYVTGRTFAQLWIPYSIIPGYDKPKKAGSAFGDLEAYILAPSAKNVEQVRQEAIENINKYDKTLETIDISAHGQPDRHWQTLFRGWNKKPDFLKIKLQHGLIFLILLLVPAVSLSGMTESRMDRRLFDRVLQSIRNYPDVESVSISRSDAVPGHGGYNGTRIWVDTTFFLNGQDINIDPNGDFFSVFNYTTDKGKKKVSVSDFDRTIPNNIILSRSTAEKFFPGRSAIGQIINERDKGERIVIGVVDDIKRFNFFRPEYMMYHLLPTHSDFIRNLDITAISIRSRSSVPDGVFKDAFKADMTNVLQTGNFYLQNLTPFTKKVADSENGITNDVKMRGSFMLFFLLNILLCVMGTFWYRIRLRREEMGIRKALGASEKGIRNLFLAEGLCLLAIAALPAIFINFQFVHAGLIDTLGKTNNYVKMYYLPDQTYLRFLITNGITWIVLAAVIIAAIWLPARKAAAMAAADALHYE